MLCINLRFIISSKILATNMIDINAGVTIPSVAVIAPSVPLNL